MSPNAMANLAIIDGNMRILICYIISCEVRFLHLSVNTELLKLFDRAWFIFPCLVRKLACVCVNITVWICWKDYFTIIKKPMDLSTIKRKLDTGQYAEPWQFVDDVWLMFENAWLYNRKSSKVHKFCTKVRVKPLSNSILHIFVNPASE